MHLAVPMRGAAALRETPYHLLFFRPLRRVYPAVEVEIEGGAIDKLSNFLLKRFRPRHELGPNSIIRSEAEERNDPLCCNESLVYECELDHRPCHVFGVWHVLVVNHDSCHASCNREP